MTLADFMALKGVSRTDMAAMLGVSPEAVRLWLIGERTPSRDKMQAIASLSAGAVMPNDFFLSSHPTGSRFSSPAVRSLSPASDGAGELSPAGAGAHTYVREGSPVVAHGEGAYGVMTTFGRSRP